MESDTIIGARIGRSGAIWAAVIGAITLVLATLVPEFRKMIWPDHQSTPRPSNTGREWVGKWKYIQRTASGDSVGVITFEPSATDQTLLVGTCVDGTLGQSIVEGRFDDLSRKLRGSWRNLTTTQNGTFSFYLEPDGTKFEGNYALGGKPLTTDRNHWRGTKQ